MPPATTTKLRRFVIGFWVTNLLVALAVVAGWFWENSSARAILAYPTANITKISKSAQTATRTLLPTLSLSPTDTLTPSLTPTAIQSPTETMTPVPFSEGPVTIGKSVQGRPLEVYRFGTGPSERLIVAGMHGGN